MLLDESSVLPARVALDSAEEGGGEFQDADGTGQDHHNDRGLGGEYSDLTGLPIFIWSFFDLLIFEQGKTWPQQK